MKKLDVKSIMTFSLIFTLCIVVIIDTAASFLGVQIEINAGILDLFKIISTAAVTYFFTRKSADSEHKKGE